MQYNWKLFKWENGTVRTELTNYLTAPIFLEKRCNEQLSSGEVVLDRVPVSAYPTPFPPKTKFTLERWVGGSLEQYYDFVVDHDDVESYAGLPDFNCHRINLIEPSVFAQGLHCDNFSLTYEQNDSTLNYKTVISSTEMATASSGVPAAGGAPIRPDSNWSYGGTSYRPADSAAWWRNLGTYTVDYGNGFIYRWAGLEALDGFTLNLNGLVSHDVSFTMPIVECYWHNGSAAATKLFDCPTRCKVTRTTLKNGVVVSGTSITVKSQLYNPTGIQAVTDENKRYFYNSDGKAGLASMYTGSYTAGQLGSGSSRAVTKAFSEGKITKLPAMINTNNMSNTSRTVSFSTTALTDQDFANQLSYEYKVSLTIEPYQSGAFVTQDTKRCVAVLNSPAWWQVPTQDYTYTTTTLTAPSASTCNAAVSFSCRNLLEDAPSNPFLIKGRKYNCFDLFRKAMLTCDTQILDNKNIGLDEIYDENFNDVGIQYPIEVSSEWVQRLKDTAMYESIFENKNLWEVMQQIGYYLHAIPYLEFSRNGKSRFVLKFKQLGGTKQNSNDSTKITVFNSQALDNYFTQYDAYVTNLFSPQNEINEWLVCKTSDNSYLVSNNTAELHTKYNITELVEFNIIYNGKTEPALDFVFEKTVYDTLSSKTDFVPAKWSALYFQMGTNKILGLNYVPPSMNGGDEFMALKTIVGRLFTNRVTDKNLKFNNLKFHVRYKTQDALRITQLRPDLEKFIKSSEFENYPHHEQFFNQQDKIVDSERFSANLWGRLIRVANGIYQCQEYARLGQEKEPGDLVTINNESYYITECENEYYADAVFQKVTYSKNFNQLSNIVTIPSEPRFFEISERSMIRREVRLLDFIKITTQPQENPQFPKFINTNKWHDFIRGLLFADGGNPKLPNFAYTNYKADVLRVHDNLPNNDTSVMFPSSDAEMTDGTVQPKASSGHRGVIVPILHFPLRNAIVFEWDMEDNFKAADCVDTTVSGNSNTADEAYYSLQPVRYCDVYGRADLFDFKLFYKDNWTDSQIQRLPFAGEDDYAPNVNESVILLPENLSIGLDKDNREALSFNYQLNLLHEPHDNDNEDFIIFSNLFGKKNNRLAAVLLNKEVSMLDEVVIMDTTTIISSVDYNLTDITNGLRIDFDEPLGINMADVKSIILYDTENGENYAYIAKNVNKLENKLQGWYVYSAFNQSNNTETPQPKEYTVNIATTGAGAAVPFGQQQVIEGQLLTVTATPQMGQSFNYFRVGRGNNLVIYQYLSNPLTLAINQDTSITAVFTGGGSSQYTVDVSAGVGGSVSPSGQQIVDTGGEVTLTATPNANMNFKHFKVTRSSNLVVYFYTSNPLTLEVNDNLVVVAVFESGGGGTIEM